MPFSLTSSNNGHISAIFLSDSLLTTFRDNGFLKLDSISTPDTTIINDSIIENDFTSEEMPERITGSGVMLEDIVIYSCVDSIDFDFRNQRVYLYGNADLKYQDIHLVADYIELCFIKNELFSKGLPDSTGFVRGLPVFTEGDQSFQAEEIRYNFESKKGRTLNVITEEAEGFLHGEIVKIMPNKEIHISGGKFTTCDKPHPHFHIGFNKAKVIPKDKIVTSFAYLKIYDVPTPLVVPFGFFPNKTGQASGIILPSYGEARNRGFYLENGGFYWGINDYVDLSLKGSIYSRGSWGLDVGSRYNKRYRYNGSFNIATATTILGEENLPGYEKSQDYRVIWNHGQDPKARPNSVFRANVNAGSSQMSRYSPVSDNDYLSNTFSSNISYSATWRGRYNFSTNLRHSQNTISKVVDLSLPEIAFSVNRFYPLRRKTVVGQYRWYENITMSYNLNAKNQISTPDSLLFREESLSKFRNGISHTIPISHTTRVFKHFNLSNNISYNERWYFQSIEKSWDYDFMDEYYIIEGDTIYGKVVTDTISGFKAGRDFSYNTSLSTRIYGLVNFKKGGLRAVRHVISPSLGFTYRPDFATPFWGSYKSYDDPRFDEPVAYSVFEQGIYGSPPSGKSGAVNFSIGNNLEIKVRSRKDTISGEKKIALIDNFSISSSYDLAQDSVNFSDLKMSGRTRLFGNFDITYSSSWTPYAVDSLGRSIDMFLWETEKRFLHLNNTAWSLSFNYNIGSNTFGGKELTPQTDNQNIGIENPDVSGNIDQTEPNSSVVIQSGQLNKHQIDYSIPWNLRFSYTFNYNSRNFLYTGQTERDYIQNLSFSGDVKLTENWRIGFQSGYDFQQKELTYTSVDIYRDLHCWEMTFNWIPFGFRQSYNFTIRVKAAVLQDLKYTRKTHHLDRYN
jgi:hypothetical protein